MRTLIRITLVCLFACAAAWAQSTAQIHGTIQDSTGAAVPGAEVKATQTATGVSRSTTSAADGGFVLTNLPLGPYRLEVSREGFTKAVESGIELQVNADPAVDVALKVGAVTEQVNVEANAALVETRSSGVGAVIENQRILELPLNGRNTADLILLAGAAVITGQTRQALFFGLNYISVGGGTAYGTDYSLDGANHNNFLTGTYMPLAFPDAVQEFKVETSGQSAQRGASASVSAVTKSGTNDFHGDLFYFIRNSGFGSAREYFATKDSPYKRNQFGGTVGGPIKKNKLLFFGGYQGSIRHENPNNSVANVPTQDMLNGDFSTFASAQCQPAARTLNAPFGTGGFGVNKIDRNQFVGPAIFETNELLKTVKQDGLTPDKCGLITYNSPSYENDKQFVGRVDYQLSDKQSLFVRSLITRQLIPNSFSIDPILLNWTNTGLDQIAQSYAVGDTYLVSPNMVNSARIAVNRTVHRYIANLAFSHCTAGVNMWCTENPQTIGNMSITGLFTMGSTSAKGEYWTGTAYSFNDDLNWIRGAHQMTFGGGFLQGRVAEYTHFASTGQTNFNGQTIGLGAADFFLGRLNTFFQGLPNTNYTRQNMANLYFTDTWKITPRLTFNFGVRWEPFLPMQSASISVFDMNRFRNGTRSTVFLKAPLGFYFPGDPGFPDSSATYRQWAHFDPRGGIAWDPKGDGKMSIRAAYAFGYAYVPGIQREDQAGSNPWGGRTTITPGGAAGSFVNPWQNFGGNPFPYVVNPNVTFTSRGQFISSPYDLPTPNTYSWNVSIQRQIGTGWVASASYIGSRVMHLYNNVAINYAQLSGPVSTAANGACPATATIFTCSGTNNTDARRVLSLLNPAEGQFVGNMDTWDASGNQNYHAMVFTAQKRLSHGVSMSANWTWSHCIGYFSGYNSKTDQTVTMPGNPLFDRGNCDSDRRHIFNLSAVAKTPRFSNSLVRAVGSDWQVAGVYSFRSGMPLSIQDGADRNLTGINHQRPNVIDPAHVYTGNSGPSAKYLTSAAFQAQPFGTIGNLGWNSIVGPTYWDIDMALSREFHLTERQSIQIRADAFNLTNSFVALPPTSGGTNNSTATPTSGAVPAFANVSSNLFGVINTAWPTRKLQFALKYTF